jgi:8-oxo-dGTP diphosphatase
MTGWSHACDSGRNMSDVLLRGEIRALVARLVPVDMVEDEHRRQALAWLDSTGDVFRRVKPCTPSPHLVSYFLLIDHDCGSVLLVDHRKARLWLPSGGYVEPGEHPVATVRREVREELGIEAVFSWVTGEQPLFVTVTQTAPAAGRHTDVSLWFVLSFGMGQPLMPDPGEFREARWWTRDDIRQSDPALFDPHLNRMLTKFDRAHATGDGS